MLDIIPTLHEGYIVSVHRMVMENRPVDPLGGEATYRIERIQHFGIIRVYDYSSTW